MKYDQMVTTAALGVLSLSQQSNFRQIVHKEIKKQFDDDYNVLFKTLSPLTQEYLDINLTDELYSSIQNHKSSIISDANMKNSWNTSIPQPFEDKDNISNVIDGFDYFDEKLYLQIYIPFIDKVDLSSTPIIVINLYDDEILPGYQLTNEGYRQIDVDENMAKENLVWVISVNETVDDYGNLPAPIQGHSGYSQKTNSKSVRFEEIRILDKKEGWGNGKADISFVGGHVDRNCVLQVPFSSISFIKVGNNDLGTWLTPNSIYRYLADAGNLSGTLPFDLVANRGIGFVLYEKDRRKRFDQQFQIDNGYTSVIDLCPDIYIFRSNESAYGFFVPSEPYSSFSSSNAWVHHAQYDWSNNGAMFKLESRCF